MSNLISNYEISVWEDVLEDGDFVERKICVIGSNEMLYQGRAHDPQLIRKSNGEKKFSFSMYKRFIDNISGETVNNPFCDFLISERKVKLYYEDKWYDFIIKNIQEDSTTYLYKYSLEDAIVQELSKNGFTQTFDASMMNNLGDIETLGKLTLQDTDWEVEADVFTERVEENLIYLKLEKDLVVQHIYDTIDGDIDHVEEEILLEGEKILAFYSSCKNKPHRFQFIYLNEYRYNNYSKNTVRVDENKIIIEPSCQFFIDIDKASLYTEQNGYFLPPGLVIEEQESAFLSDEEDTLISNWFRGKRFGFSPVTQYVPLIKQYCKKYYKRKGEGVELYKGEPVEYFGYLNTEFASALYADNIVTNTEFKSTAGWIGTYAGGTPNAKQDYGAKITPVFGLFTEGGFCSSEDALRNGTFEPGIYTPYLKVEFPEIGLLSEDNRGILMNSGFSDAKYKLNNVAPGDKWRFEATLLTSDGEEISPSRLNRNFNITLQEVRYSAATGNHVIEELVWGKYYFEKGKGWIRITQDIPADLTPKEFKKKKIYLVITPKDGYNLTTTIYIKDMKMYKQILNANGEEVVPGEFDTSGVTVSEYCIAKKTDIEAAKELDDLKVTKIDANKINYNEYIPVYNDGAKKVRTITAKESNYFNILQSIAETFEAWLELAIERNDLEHPGRITRKVAKFKRYLGDNNYAAFRYGVNLKDIKRTYESKALTTKLIVKPNKNELAPKGFCTISRAGSNPTGESYIYDFRYFHNTGLLPAADYVAQLYYPINPYTWETQLGKDIDERQKKTNIQNYFNRLKALNDIINDLSDKKNNLTLELVDLEAEQEVQEAAKETAEEEIATIRDDFHALTNFYPEEINGNPFASIEVQEAEKEPINPTWPGLTSVVIEEEPLGSSPSTNWRFNVDLCPDFNETCTIPSTINNEGKDFTKCLCPFGKATLSGTPSRLKIASNGPYAGVLVAPIDNGYEVGGVYEISFKLTVQKGILYELGVVSEVFKNLSMSIDDGAFTACSTVSQPAKYFKNNLTAGASVKMTVRGTYVGGGGARKAFTITPNYAFYKQPSEHLITDLTLKKKEANCEEEVHTYYFNKEFVLTRTVGENGEAGTQTIKQATIACEIPGYSLTGTVDYSLTLIDTSQSSLARLLTEYATQYQYLTEAEKKLGSETEGLIKAINDHKEQIKALEEELSTQTSYKNTLNKIFYSKYSRFIREGTWISEEYVDDDKYYNDALSVLYDSCFPQVEYSINVIAVSSLPGYEHFKFALGDKTYAIDPDFFGTEDRVEVVITEQTDHLDNPDKNAIKVQTFKNQFKDLFQKITATVQQAKYSTGSYEKAVALVEADAAIKSQFISDALAGAQGKLSVAGQTSVVMNQSGITLTDSATKDEMRLIGGAILMSTQDPETGERRWKTGLTPDGISASLITAGTINAGEIMIMNADEPVFRWDAFGLSAFDVDWSAQDVRGATNPYKFVRFDKHGIYGINTEADDDGIDGRTWKPTSNDEINQLATFALTWEGLKVTGEDGVEARIGWVDKTNQEDSKIFQVKNKEEETFVISGSGNVSMKGNMEATGGKIGPFNIYLEDTLVGEKIEYAQDEYKLDGDIVRGLVYIYQYEEDLGDEKRTIPRATVIFNENGLDIRNPGKMYSQDPYRPGIRLYDPPYNYARNKPFEILLEGASSESQRSSGLIVAQNLRLRCYSGLQIEVGWPGSTGKVFRFSENGFSESEERLGEEDYS